MLGGLGSESSLTNERMGMGRVPGLEPWKTESKWNGTPSTRKNYTEKVEGTLKRFPEMMATWQSKLTGGYTVENFAWGCNGSGFPRRLGGEQKQSGQPAGGRAAGASPRAA